MAAKRRFQHIQSHLTIHLHRKRNLKISINKPNTTCQPSTMLLIFILTLAVRTLVVRAVKSTFDEEIRKAITKDPWELVEEYSNARTLDSLSRLNHQWNEDGFLKEEKERKRVAEKLEREQLVNELEGFRTKSAPRFDHDFMSLMNASEEIEHYLNGFDLRMYEWMRAFYIRVNDAVLKEIEGFALKLAQHRATYTPPPPHRRGKQEQIPKFDAFIKMRDDNMEILQIRMQKDHIMIYDPLSSVRGAMIQTMRIMETIGIVIGYPGVQEMQKEGAIFAFRRYNKQQVQKLLVGTVDIRQLEYDYDDTRSLREVLSLESCIGRKAADNIMENVRQFVQDLAHIEAETDFSRRKLGNELERLRNYVQQTPDMSPDFMKDASEEIEHFLNGFDSRMSSAMGIFHSKSHGEVQRQIEEFVITLAQHRATYPRLPPHHLGDQREMPLFDAFIKMRDDNMEILHNRIRKDHMMFAVHYGAPLCWERQAVMEVIWIMENIGIVIGYPGLQEMSQKVREPWKYSQHAQQKARDFLLGNDDFFEWECGVWTVKRLLSRNSCIGVTATEVVVQNVKKFIDLWRGLQ